MSKTKYNPILLDAVEYCELVDLLDEGKPVPADNPIHRKSKKWFTIKKDFDICVVSIEERGIVISFQGSKQIKDWFNNFNGFMDCDGIHDGWHRCAKKFIPDLVNIISGEGIEKKVFFFAHSRGGALAILCAYHITKLLGSTINIITFGAPMVGNAEFRDEFRELPINSTRCEIGRDPVPRLAPKVMGYKKESFVKELNDKGWYFLPIPGVGFRAHVDYYSNVRKWT
jgi:hypothetical protein